MIINADDFGMSREVNRAIVQCFAEGRINRTTLMVNMPDTDNAVELARQNGFMGSVGLHINLTEGRPLTEACRKSVLCDQNGFFNGTFHVPKKARFFLDAPTRRAISEETEAQIRKYLAYGFSLKHADSHNYTHTYFSVALPVNRLLEQYGFRSVRISRNLPPHSMSPLFAAYKWLYNAGIRRLKTSSGRIATTRYFGSLLDFEKTDNSSGAYNDTELMTHPILRDGVLFDDTLPAPRPFHSPEWVEKNAGRLENFSDNRIRLLVTFLPAHVGGAMTSLVNFLNALDLEKYRVDVLFYENDGGRHGIKEGVNLLAPAKTHRTYSVSNIFGKLLYPPYLFAKIGEQYYKKIAHDKKKAVQLMAKQGCRYSRRLNETYDIAVAYEFDWCLHYMVKYVKAKKKIAWHHTDFEAAGLKFSVDRRAFDKTDAMVFVSRECMNKFTTAHPQYKERSLYLPNILSSDYVKKRGGEPVALPFESGEGFLKLLSVARIDFTSKGLDRGVNIIERLKNEGLAEKVRWLIIGKGKHLEELTRMIREKKLEAYIFPIGLRENPIPYMKKCDVLFLPSRYEGKPMVVTEAQMMELVPLVSRYTSADEQIQDGVDGFICDNSEQALYEGVKRLVLHPERADAVRKHLAEHDYGNEREIARFDELVRRLTAENHG